MRWDLQLDSRLPRPLLFCERVSVWAMLLATPPWSTRVLFQPLRLLIQSSCASDVFSREWPIRRVKAIER